MSSSDIAVQKAARCEAAKELQEWLYKNRFEDWTETEKYWVWCDALVGLGVNTGTYSSIGACRVAVEAGKADPDEIKAIFSLLFL